MPGGDGTGPLGRGPLTGRGLGPCGRGLAFRRGLGRGFRYRYVEPTPLSKEEEKRMLEEEKKELERRLKELSEQG